MAKIIEFTEADLKNPELQAEYFGIYAEMPSFDGFIAIPRNQYEFFRGFIKMVCKDRVNEIAEMQELRAENEKLKSNTQNCNNQCFAKTSNL